MSKSWAVVLVFCGFVVMYLVTIDRRVGQLEDGLAALVGQTVLLTGDLRERYRQEEDTQRTIADVAADVSWALSPDLFLSKADRMIRTLDTADSTGNISDGIVPLLGKARYYGASQAEIEKRVRLLERWIHTSKSSYAKFVRDAGWFHSQMAEVRNYKPRPKE